MPIWIVCAYKRMGINLQRVSVVFSTVGFQNELKLYICGNVLFGGSYRHNRVIRAHKLRVGFHMGI